MDNPTDPKSLPQYEVNDSKNVMKKCFKHATMQFFTHSNLKVIP